MTRQNVMLALSIVAIISIVLALLVFHVDGNSAVGGALIALIGRFSADISTAFNYEFGSSRSSQPPQT